MFSRQRFSNATKHKEKRVSTPRPEIISNEFLWPTCSRHGKRHKGRFLVSEKACFSSGQSGRMMKDFPKTKLRRR